MTTYANGIVTHEEIHPDSETAKEWTKATFTKQRRINVILLASLLLVFVAGCPTRTEIYLAQSQEREDPESQSAYYTGTDCTGATTEDIFQAKSAFLDAYLYGVEVDKTTGLVAVHPHPASTEDPIGFAKGCVSIEQKGFFEKKFVPIIALTGTLRAAVGLYRGEEPDLEFQMDGRIRMTSILEPLGLSSANVVTTNDVKILEDPSIELLGGLATGNSATSLVDQVVGSVWTYRLIFPEEEGS